MQRHRHALRPSELGLVWRRDMLEKPDLQDESIAACLRDRYGIPVAHLDFLPLGNDSNAWVYRVDADGGDAYFLKVKSGRFSQSCLTIPRYLRDQGIRQVVAPLPTLTGTLFMCLEQFRLLLYPFIDGWVGMDVGLSDRQWAEFGAVLQKIHATCLPDWLSAQLRREDFVPKWSDLVRILSLGIDEPFADPYQRELAAFWRQRRHEIAAIVSRTKELGQMLQQQPLPLLLCHADIHTANILIDQDDRLFLVDWDEALLAPRERDLMFVVGDDITHTRQAALFFDGYGSAEINSLALAYYRYEWVVQEIGDFGERVFLMPELGAATKDDSVRGFRQLFDPGEVVEAAYNSD